MSIKKAKELGATVERLGSETQFVERWTLSNVRVEIVSVSSFTAPRSDIPHFIRKISVQNGQTTLVSEVYANRSSARRAALAQFRL